MRSGSIDPLLAKGFVLLGPDRPIVVLSIDWCEIRNDAYARWQDVLAQAAATDAERVLVTSIHQHDVPLPDLEAERILREHDAGVQQSPTWTSTRRAQRTAAALRSALASSRRLTHVGTGQAPVAEIASNRRYIVGDGPPRYDRTSMSGGEPDKRDAPAGTVDEQLKTLSFWDDAGPVCALSALRGRIQ